MDNRIQAVGRFPRTIDEATPQGVLRDTKSSKSSLNGTVAGELGHHTLFLQIGDARHSYWHPIDIEIRPRVEILTPQISRAGECTFRLRNNSAVVTLRNIEAHWAGANQLLEGDLRPGEAGDFRIPSGTSSLLLGENQLTVTAPSIETVAAKIPYWPSNPETPSKEPWKTIRLDSLYDESLENLLSRKFWSSDYKYAPCFDYLLAHLNGDRSRPPNATSLRKKVNTEGIFETAYGLPFAQRAAGDNMIALSLWNDFRRSVEVPIDQSAHRIYLLLSAITFPMQSHIANGRVTVRYIDGSSSALDLVNPTNLDNGIGTFGGTYHYTANGHVMIGEVPPFEYPPQPMLLLRQHGVPDHDEEVHPAWENSARTRPPLASHADIIGVDCDPAKKIRIIQVEARANNVILALFGLTLLP